MSEELMPDSHPEEKPKDISSEILRSAQNDSAVNPLHVKLAVYDGPLDLLLELIKKTR